LLIEVLFTEESTLKSKSLFFSAVAVLMMFSTSLLAIPVAGTANIFSAGQDANGGSPGGGTYAVLGASGLTGGSSISFSSITGTTNCGGAAPCNAPPINPDGSALTFTVGATDGTNIPTASVGTGISGIVFNGRQMFLVGVFLNDLVPSGFGPFADTYTNANSTQTVFAPLLNQVFFIGDGKTGTCIAGCVTQTGSAQTFVVPTGGTRLFLGFADSFNNFSGAPSAYGDNTGSLSVTLAASAVPEPGTVLLMGLGLVAIGMLRKRIA
jgi:hypothetical protein